MKGINSGHRKGKDEVILFFSLSFPSFILLYILTFLHSDSILARILIVYSTSFMWVTDNKDFGHPHP
jgi:ABC-type dipeptide/oligopeptide/nickel transport system permease subunit